MVTGISISCVWDRGISDERPPEARGARSDRALAAGADDVGLRRQHPDGGGMGAQRAAQRSTQSELYHARDVAHSGIVWTRFARAIAYEHRCQFALDTHSAAHAGHPCCMFLIIHLSATVSSEHDAKKILGWMPRSFDGQPGPKRSC